MAREIQVTMGPQKSFRYALFSETTLDIKNNTTVVGDIFSNAKLLVENNAVICGNKSPDYWDRQLETKWQAYAHAAGVRG